MTCLPERFEGAVAFRFGDTPELADELLALVLSGRKTATCTWAADYEEGRESMPEIGRRDIVLDGDDRPAAVIETVEIARRRFFEVDADFACDEGEGDLSLADWRVAHETYFNRTGGFSPDMELVCERFRLVEVLDRLTTEGGQ